MWVADKVLCALLYFFSVYFLTNELRQMYHSSFEYFSSIWNYCDFLPPTLIIAIVSIKLRVQFCNTYKFLIFKYRYLSRWQPYLDPSAGLIPCTCKLPHVDQTFVLHENLQRNRLFGEDHLRVHIRYARFPLHLLNMPDCLQRGFHSHRWSIQVRQWRSWQVPGHKLGPRLRIYIRIGCWRYKSRQLRL